MLVNCNSCQKKFNVPDSAITQAGRLLQCGSCGNKWTQYPIKPKFIEEEKSKKLTPSVKPNKLKEFNKKDKVKTSVKKKKREINLYSEEYLKKKHGLVIKDKIDNKITKKYSNSLNFFNYLIILIIFIIAFFGILNLTRDFIIAGYPFTENYINSLFEIFEILKTTISIISN
mgnify:FL=1